jgi:hypothetical protein
MHPLVKPGGVQSESDHASNEPSIKTRFGPGFGRPPAHGGVRIVGTAALPARHPDAGGGDGAFRIQAGDEHPGGHLRAAIIVLVCSIIIPVCKLTGLLVLSSEQFPIGALGRDRVWRFLEITGRWGMLDVLLVAALVAAVKLGDLVSIESGPGLYAFAGTVVLSLLASASWDPALIGGRRR